MVQEMLCDVAAWLSAGVKSKKERVESYKVK